MWNIFKNGIKIGTYDKFTDINDIISHEIYLYNCDIKDGIDKPVPKFIIESNLED